MNNLTSLNATTACKEIDNKSLDIIVDRIVDEMAVRIKDIDPCDDIYAEYTENWTFGHYGDSAVIWTEYPYNDYEIYFEYELTWKYRKWTEQYTDPYGSERFSDIKNENGIVLNIEITTPDGETIQKDICDAIVERVNNKINKI